MSGGGDDVGEHLDVEAALPGILALGFNPALDGVLFLAAGPEVLSFPDHRLHVHLDWQHLDENYRDMGGFEMAGLIRADAGRIRIRGQFVEARTRMEPGE